MTSYISPIPLFKPTMRFVSMFDDPPPLVSHKDEMNAQQTTFPFLPKPNGPIVVNTRAFPPSSVLIPSRIASNASIAPSYPSSNSNSNASFNTLYPAPNSSLNASYPTPNNSSIASYPSPNIASNALYPPPNIASFAPLYPHSMNSNASLAPPYPPSINSSGASVPLNHNISSATRRGLFSNSQMIPRTSKQELLDLCEKYELSKVGNKKKIIKRLHRKGIFAKEANVKFQKLTWSQNSKNRDLIEACKSRKLSPYGNKEELLQRLRDDEELRIEKRIKGMPTPQDNQNPVKLFETIPTHSIEIQNKNVEDSNFKAAGQEFGLAIVPASEFGLAVVEKRLFPESTNKKEETSNTLEDKNNVEGDDKEEQFEVEDSIKNCDEDDEDKLVIDEDEVETYGGIFNEEQQISDNLLHINESNQDIEGDDENTDKDLSKQLEDIEGDEHGENEENLEDNEGVNEDMAEMEDNGGINEDMAEMEDNEGINEENEDMAEIEDNRGVNGENEDMVEMEHNEGVNEQKEEMDEMEDNEGVSEENQDMVELEENGGIQNSNLHQESYYSDENDEGNEEFIKYPPNNVPIESVDYGMEENETEETEKLLQEEEIELPDNEEELVYVLNANKTEDSEEEPTEELKDNKSTFFAWGTFLGSSGTSEKVKFIS